MKLSDPSKLSLAVAVVVTAIAAVLFILPDKLIRSFPSYLWVFSIAFLLIFSWLLYRYTLEKFIYEKIKIIYKTIHHLKRPKENERLKLNIGSDTIEKVNQEVAEWGENKTKEIEELKRLAAYRREFIGNVSHELKTPIFNIQGYVLTLLDGGLEDNSINREYLLRTEKSINRMIAIVEDLETISQLEAGVMKLNFSRFDVVTLAREVVSFLEIKSRRKKHTIFFADTYERPIFIFADKERIRQVFINLIDNAIKYSTTEDGRTKLSFFDMDELILVEVTDNGIGITPHDIPRVFERFYRTDKARSREQGGTGLGLAIVKHIIEAHEQTINVRSTVGVGTTFAFTLKKAR